MKNIRTVFLLLGLNILAMWISNLALAASPDLTNTDLNILAGTAVSTNQLSALRARGDVVVTSVSNGNVSGNSVGSNSVTGSITDNQSINNNTGITTVFQNTGNNSLFQSSTSIYISVR